VLRLLLISVHLVRTGQPSDFSLTFWNKSGYYCFSEVIWLSSLVLAFIAYMRRVGIYFALPDAK
jgi:hypothetical protein